VPDQEEAMSSNPTADATSSLKYATKFEERILGVECDVEVCADLSLESATVIAAMRQPLRSTPSCHISIEGLEELRASIHEAHVRAQLLEDLVDGARDHQLNCSCSIARLVVVKPRREEKFWERFWPSPESSRGRPPRFVLTIGEFHREGPLDQLSTSDVDAAIGIMDALRTRVLAKIAQRHGARDSTLDQHSQTPVLPDLGEPIGDL
jgi:hypothetical protein